MHRSWSMYNSLLTQWTNHYITVVGLVNETEHWGRAGPDVRILLLMSAPAQFECHRMGGGSARAHQWLTERASRRERTSKQAADIGNVGASEIALLPAPLYIGAQSLSLQYTQTHGTWVSVQCVVAYIFYRGVMSCMADHHHPGWNPSNADAYPANGKCKNVPHKWILFIIIRVPGPVVHFMRMPDIASSNGIGSPHYWIKTTDTL